MHGNYLPARDPVRARQVTAALWLVSISVGFGLLSGTVSVITGLNGHSLSVLAIGLGVLADVTGSATGRINTAKTSCAAAIPAPRQHPRRSLCRAAIPPAASQHAA